MGIERGEVGRGGEGREEDAKRHALSACLPISHSPSLPLFLPCSAETPERRSAPLRCSDVSFIVKHLLRAADTEAIAQQAYAPTQGGWPHEIPQFRAADDEASAYFD